MPWCPKLTVCEYYPNKNDKVCGFLKIVYYDRETKKPKFAICRFGKKFSRKEAYDKINIKRQKLIEQLTIGLDEGEENPYL